MKKHKLSAYISQVDVMFDGVVGDLERIGQEFVNAAAEQLVETTPGPDLQYELTEYIATGRLRAGWHFGTTTPPATATRDEGGPYDISRSGGATKARLRQQIFSNGLQKIVFLWNEVAYALYVHDGQGNHQHIGPRPWVYDASKLGQEFLAIARERARSPA